MDPDADNYNPNANVDDDSCTYPPEPVETSKCTNSWGGINTGTPFEMILGTYDPNDPAYGFNFDSYSGINPYISPTHDLSVEPRLWFHTPAPNHDCRHSNVAAWAITRHDNSLNLYTKDQLDAFDVYFTANGSSSTSGSITAQTIGPKIYTWSELITAVQQINNYATPLTVSLNYTNLVDIQANTYPGQPYQIFVWNTNATCCGSNGCHEASMCEEDDGPCWINGCNFTDVSFTNDFHLAPFNYSNTFRATINNNSNGNVFIDNTITLTNNYDPWPTGYILYYYQGGSWSSPSSYVTIASGDTIPGPLNRFLVSNVQGGVGSKYGYTVTDSDGCKTSLYLELDETNVIR